jgi:hypothetical protein
VGPTINTDGRDRKQTLLAVDEAVVSVAESKGPRWDDACELVLTEIDLLLNGHGATGEPIWCDEATRVPLQTRSAEFGCGIDNRLAGPIDIAPTILRAAGATVQQPVDGMSPQEVWDRQDIPIEPWDKREDGTKRVPFIGIKGTD